MPSKELHTAYFTVQYADVRIPRVLFRVPCKERDGVYMRTVREMPQTPDWAAVIASQMGKVRNFLGAQDHQRVFLDPNSHFCLVDDVGLIGAVGIVEDVSAHVHMTFWDKRMRGREVLASMIVGYLMNAHNLGGIWTGVPKKHNAVIGFAKRVGFKPFYEDDKVVGLLFLRRDY